MIKVKEMDINMASNGLEMTFTGHSNKPLKKKSLQTIYQYLAHYEGTYSLKSETRSDGDVIIKFSYRARASNWVNTLTIDYDPIDKEYAVYIKLYHCELEDDQYIYFRGFKTITVTTIQNLLNDHSSMFGNQYFDKK